MVQRTLFPKIQKPKPYRTHSYPLVHTAELYPKVKLKHLYKIDTLIPYIEEDAQLSINTYFYQLFLDLKGVPIKLWQYAGSYDKLKSLSQWAQKSGPRIKYWNLLVNVEVLYGWRPAQIPLGPRVKKWLQDKFIPTYNDSSELFNTMFEETAFSVIDWKNECVKFDMTMMEFCENIVLQGTSGSAYDPNGPKLKCHLDDIEVKPTNNKFSKTMALSVENRYKRFTSFEKQKARISIKMEFYPKERMICSSDYNLTQMMRYVDQFLIPWMDGHPESTLWQSNEGAINMWTSFSKPTRMWNCPVDHDKFDFHVSMDMVLAVVRATKRLIIKRVMGLGKHDLLSTMDRIIYKLNGGEITYEELDGVLHTISYLNGLISGLQWTAYIGTVSNITERRMALKLMEQNQIKTISGYFSAQGDDQFSQFTTATMCISYWAALTSMGFELHIHKNFFSNIHNEYLRKFADGKQVNGYASRLIQSILWLYPGQNMPSDKMVRMKNIVSNWTKLAERLEVKTKILLSHILKDLKGAKININEAITYMSTAKSLGGSATLDTKYDVKFETTPSTRKTVSIDGPGYRQFQLRFGEYQSRELSNWAQSVIGLPNTIKDRNGKEEEIYTEGEFKIKEVSIKPLPIIIASDKHIKMLKHEAGWNNGLIFGSSKQLANEIFPGFDEYAKQQHAPKKWVFDMLAGRVDPISPNYEGFSEEFSAMFFKKYRQSLLHAMCKKQTRNPYKWESIQLYCELNRDLTKPNLHGILMRG